MVEANAAAWASRSLESVLGVAIRRLEPLPEPEYAFDPARSQYSSTLILRDAIPRRPAAAEKLLVLTERDLFIPMLSFVYGQAQLDGPAAILSFARLRQEFYGLPSNPSLFLLRVRKEVLHEIGHAYGLTHCENPQCTMALSTDIRKLDAKGDGFCGDCELLLHDALAASRTAAVSQDGEPDREKAVGNSDR